MDVVFFVNSITEFNHMLPIINEIKLSVTTTESTQVLQYIKKISPVIQVFKINRQNLTIFKPKVVVFAGDWILVQLKKNLFLKRPPYKEVQAFHGIIDKNKVYTKENFKDSTSHLFKLFYLLNKFNLRSINPLSDKPHKFVDKLNLDRLVPNRFDLILLSGKMMGEILLRKGLLSQTNFAKVGVPKTDALFSKKYSQNKTLKRLGLDETKKTVLYTPTWSTSSNYCLSSIPKFGLGVCKSIRDEINFIFKPHQNVQRLNEFPKQIRRMKSVISRKRNMKFLDPSIDAVTLMRISDLLITDFSSVGIEFLLLDRPIIFLDHLGKRYSDPNLLDIQIRETGVVVDEIDKLHNTIDYCIKNPKEKSKIRRQYARKLFYFSDGKSSSRAAEAIKRLAKS